MRSKSARGVTVLSLVAAFFFACWIDTWPGLVFHGFFFASPLPPPPSQKKTKSKEAVAYTRRISDVFQDNYSGMTCSLLVLNAPWVFSKGWQVIESEKRDRAAQEQEEQEKIDIVVPLGRRASCQ